MNIIEELRAHNRWRCGGDGPATDAKRLTMLIDAACDALEQAGWRDIATAPKDGRQVLLATPSGRIADGYWSLHYKVWSWPYVLVNPTHWMPTPSAPTPRAA